MKKYIDPVIHSNNPAYNPPEPYEWESSGKTEECQHCGRWTKVDDNGTCEDCYIEHDDYKIYPEEN